MSSQQNCNAACCLLLHVTDCECARFHDRRTRNMTTCQLYNTAVSIRNNVDRRESTLYCVASLNLTGADTSHRAESCVVGAQDIRTLSEYAGAKNMYVEMFEPSTEACSENAVLRLFCTSLMARDHPVPTDVSRGAEHDIE